MSEINIKRETYKPKAKSTDASIWTRFMDMHSGGGAKLDYENILIHAPERRAREIFEEYFERDSNNVTCECCGEDYSVSEDTYDKHMSIISEYHSSRELLFILDVE